MVCPSCGWTNSASAATCSQCGLPLADAVADGAVSDDPGLRASTATAPATSAADGEPSAAGSQPAGTPPTLTAASGQRLAAPIPSYVPPPSYYEQLAQSSASGRTQPPAVLASLQTNEPRGQRRLRRERRVPFSFGQFVTVVLVLALVVAGIAFTISRGPRGFGSLGGLGSAANARPTPTSTLPPRVVVYSSPLDIHTTGWEHQDGCTFEADGLHVTDNFTCFAPITEQTDVEVSVTMRQISGPTFKWAGGISLRSTPATAYQFVASSDGTWAFFKCLKDQQYCTPLVQKDSAVLHTGLGAVNTLDVSARGSHFEFALNGKSAGSFDDTTFPAGIEGVVGNDGVEAAFTNLSITALH